MPNISYFPLNYGTRLDSPSKIIFPFLLSWPKSGRYLHKVCINYNTENSIAGFLLKIPIFLF